MQRKSRRPRAGLSQIEVVICTLLVGMMLVAAMNAVGAAIRGRVSTGDAARARELAVQLMAEILANDYIEPVDTPTFGRETGEFDGTRARWDDVDDYHHWMQAPPWTAAELRSPIRPAGSGP